MSSTEPTANEMAAERTVLARKRTVMATDRTLMAWVRTGLSVISFGFTIYKVLGALQGMPGAVLRTESTPRDVGLFLTGIGTLALVCGVVEYIVAARSMRAEGARVMRPSLFIAVAIALLGVYLFFGIFRRAV